MTKWYGTIGFADTEEISPGVWSQTIVEHPYYGDITRNSRQYSTSSDKVNDDLGISNELSVIADPYFRENFHLLRYVKFMGTNWKVESVEIDYPRMRLSLGGVYNGDTARTSSDST